MSDKEALDLIDEARSWADDAKSWMQSEAFKADGRYRHAYVESVVARIATLEAGMADLMHVVYTFHIHAPERDKWGAWLLDYYGKKHEP